MGVYNECIKISKLKGFNICMSKIKKYSPKKVIVDKEEYVEEQKVLTKNDGLYDTTKIKNDLNRLIKKMCDIVLEIKSEIPEDLFEDYIKTCTEIDVVY